MSSFQLPETPRNVESSWKASSEVFQPTSDVPEI